MQAHLEYESLEKLCGSRLTTNYARIGGLSHDLYPGFADEIRAKLRDLVTAHEVVMKLVARNRIFLDRTVGVGAISQADALSWGFTGPCLRATGLAWDLRKLAPYSGYEKYEFEIPTGTTGETPPRLWIGVGMTDGRFSLGIDGAGLERAVWMLNSALVADLASRRWPEPGSAAGPGEPDRKV